MRKWPNLRSIPIALFCCTLAIADEQPSKTSENRRSSAAARRTIGDSENPANDIAAEPEAILRGGRSIGIEADIPDASPSATSSFGGSQFPDIELSSNRASNSTPARCLSSPRRVEPTPPFVRPTSSGTSSAVKTDRQFCNSRLLTVISSASNSPATTSVCTSIRTAALPTSLRHAKQHRQCRLQTTYSQCTVGTVQRLFTQERRPDRLHLCRRRR